MAELQPIIVFHSRHFVRHLGIYYRICVNLLQLMSGIITHNSTTTHTMCVVCVLCVCVRACVCSCVRACVRVCVCAAFVDLRKTV